eukprot:5286926-Amphidinium_carterae.1
MQFLGKSVCSGWVLSVKKPEAGGAPCLRHSPRHDLNGACLISSAAPQQYKSVSSDDPPFPT